MQFMYLECHMMDTPNTFPVLKNGEFLRSK